MDILAMSHDLLNLNAMQGVRLIHDGKPRPKARRNAYLDHIFSHGPRFDKQITFTKKGNRAVFPA